jgi:hypothetical protein
MKMILRPSFLLALATLGLFGCAGYEPLGTHGEQMDIAVAPVINESELAQIIAPLARNVREGIAHSPNWRLVSEEDAEAVLRLTILEVERDALARDPEDTGRPLSFHELVRVAVEWDSSSPAPWGENPVIEVESDQILYAQPSLVNSQAMAMSQLADRLAAKVLQKLDWIEAAE